MQVTILRGKDGFGFTICSDSPVRVQAVDPGQSRHILETSSCRTETATCVFMYPLFSIVYFGMLAMEFVLCHTLRWSSSPGWFAAVGHSASAEWPTSRALEVCGLGTCYQVCHSYCGMNY